MRARRFVPALLAAVATAAAAVPTLAPAPAEAGRGSVSIGIGFGSGWGHGWHGHGWYGHSWYPYGGWYSAYPYYGYYAAPPVVVYAPSPSRPEIVRAPPAASVASGVEEAAPSGPPAVRVAGKRIPPYYDENGAFCREDRREVTVDGRPQEVLGVTCLGRDGVWRPGD